MHKRCEVCHKRFKLNSTQIRVGTAKYCSRHCKVIGHAEYMRKPLEQRFWSKVAKAGDDECWLWTAGTFGDGYGAINVGGKIERASRVSYRLTNGDIPDGLVIRHTCDNKECVNPNHLLTGTQWDNARDKMERGRQSRPTKLSFSDVATIRALDAKQSEIAAMFGVSQSLVSLIKANPDYRATECNSSWLRRREDKKAKTRAG